MQVYEREITPTILTNNHTKGEHSEEYDTVHKEHLNQLGYTPVRIVNSTLLLYRSNLSLELVDTNSCSSTFRQLQEVMNSIELLTSLWPILLGFITLVIVLAKMHSAITVLEEKIKVAFELINKLNSK